jgi:branched-chain amino acid transport system substrate-binding protein
MKKVLSIALVLMFCLVMLASCGSKNYAENNTEYVIGLSGPLTGGAAMYGTAVKNAAQMAVDEINEAGGLNGIKFKLIALDDMHDPTKIATNYSSLLEAGMQLSLGTVTTGPGLEFKNLSKDDNVFFLTPSASGDAIPEFSNGYQMCFADGNQGKVAAEFVNANFKGQTIGAFYKSDDSYSAGIFAQFKESLDASVTVVETNFTDANKTDFSTPDRHAQKTANSSLCPPILRTRRHFHVSGERTVLDPRPFTTDATDLTGSTALRDLTSTPFLRKSQCSRTSIPKRRTDSQRRSSTSTRKSTALTRSISSARPRTTAFTLSTAQ